VAGSSEHVNEHSGSIKGRQFTDNLSDYQLLRKDFAPCSFILKQRNENLHNL
jgi:hypothetical protein